MRRFFISREEILSGRPTLSGAELKHIQTVLRLKPGDEILLFDGQGLDYRARIESTGRKVIALAILEQFPSISAPAVKITIGQALLKGRKMDRLVRQVTELGIHSLIPVIAQRSVPKAGRWDEKDKRWRAIARESLKQCGRSHELHIQPPVSFQAAVEHSGSYDLKLIFHHEEMSSWAAGREIPQGETENVLALVGPEGGFAAGEVKLAVESGFRCVSFGPRTLKADTAALAACAILQHVLGDAARVLKKA